MSTLISSLITKRNVLSTFIFFPLFPMQREALGNRFNVLINVSINFQNIKYRSFLSHSNRFQLAIKVAHLFVFVSFDICTYCTGTLVHISKYLLFSPFIHEFSYSIVVFSIFDKYSPSWFSIRKLQVLNKYQENKLNEIRWNMHSKSTERKDNSKKEKRKKKKPLMSEIHFAWHLFLSNRHAFEWEEKEKKNEKWNFNRFKQNIDLISSACSNK